jgi:RimJ/RimL family protein N-acetyltransferase
MIGDTNLFFCKNDDGDLIGETEIMVAEKSARGGRRGWEAMLLMLRYGNCTDENFNLLNFCIYLKACQNLSVRLLEAKIGLENKPSLRMFEKLGFKEVNNDFCDGTFSSIVFVILQSSRSTVFKEATLLKEVDSEFLTWLLHETSNSHTLEKRPD